MRDGVNENCRSKGLPVTWIFQWTHLRGTFAADPCGNERGTDDAPVSQIKPIRKRLKSEDKSNVQN